MIGDYESKKTGHSEIKSDMRNGKTGFFFFKKLADAILREPQKNKNEIQED